MVGEVLYAAYGHAGPHDALLLYLCVAMAVLLVVAFVAATGALRLLAALARERRTLYRARKLTPEKVVGYKRPAHTEEDPNLMSRRIVERSEQIRRSLRAGPSEVEIAMCTLGYSACADDLLTLIELANKMPPECGPIGRLRMRAAVRLATNSLANTRKAFRQYARATPSAGARQNGTRWS